MTATNKKSTDPRSLVVKWQASLGTFYSRHHDWENRNGISMSTDRVPFVVVIFLFVFPHKLIIFTAYRLSPDFFNMKTRRMSLLEQKLITLLNTVFIPGVTVARVARPLFYV